MTLNALLLATIQECQGSIAKGCQRLPNFGNNEKSVFLTNAKSRIASVVLDSVLGPLRLAHHTPDSVFVSLLCFQVQSSRQVEGP